MSIDPGIRLDSRLIWESEIGDAAAKRTSTAKDPMQDILQRIGTLMH